MKFWLSMIKSRFLKAIFKSNEYNFRNINLYSFTASITRWTTTTRSTSIIARYINRRRNNVKDSHVGHGMIRINYYTTTIYFSSKQKREKENEKKGYKGKKFCCTWNFISSSLHFSFDRVSVFSFNSFDICYISKKINQTKIN